MDHSKYVNVIGNWPKISQEHLNNTYKTNYLKNVSNKKDGTNEKFINMFHVIEQNILRTEEQNNFRALAFVQTIIEMQEVFEFIKIELSDIYSIYSKWMKNNKKSQDLFITILNKCRYISLIISDKIPSDIAIKYMAHYQKCYENLLNDKISKLSSENLNTTRTLHKHIEELKTDISNSAPLDIKKERQALRRIIGNAEKTEKELNEKNEKAAIVLGSVAENKNAGKYKEYYENCRKSAFWLFWASLAIMISTAITVTYNCVAYGMLDQSDFSGLLSRISLTALVLLPSFFMMREAKKLKDKEFQYYDMMCRIVTSAPYIDGLTHLDDNQKDRMKADLVKDFFARPIECRDDGGLVPIEEICKIIKACLGEK